MQPLKITSVVFPLCLVSAALALGQQSAGAVSDDPVDRIAKSFAAPPSEARPWVYWYFMDGNLTREGITADLEAMKKAGIGGAIFLEVNVGVPRGPVDFMSPKWLELFAHAAHEAQRLGLELSVGSGPGWCGTGGPWITPELAMQHLVASETTVHGPGHFAAVLPRPRPRTPFFGLGTLTPELKKAWQEFYVDVAVLAFPTPQGNLRIADIDEKALYYRAPYSSAPGVKPFLAEPDAHAPSPAEQCIARQKIIDLTSRLRPDGTLTWDPPAGDWTILRFGRTITGQTTRPAPQPGLGLETDKFDKAAIDAHFAAFTAKLLAAVGPRKKTDCGLTTLHFDSWEMGSQNWSKNFPGEFRKRRGYDPLPYLPVMTGRVVESVEISERFLFDLRQTAQELVLENHVGRLKELGRQNGLKLSLEPYDMNPTADLNLGSVADVPMCEFWSKGHGFTTEYSCLEAVSIAHTGGAKVIGAESFTAGASDTWLQYPASMKAQTDWAFAAGINRLVIHRYQHQPALDQFPGMTMGPYGVHWERTQTWWDMVGAYHRYLARCQYLLRRGLPVADILYLTPEGAPHVFTPPASATVGDPPDRRGYNFDGVSPETLIKSAMAKEGKIVFPGGVKYSVLVLPRCEAMTPGLVMKIKQLLAEGATVIGSPPERSPSLTDYPHCDEIVRRLAAETWKAKDLVQNNFPIGKMDLRVRLLKPDGLGGPSYGSPVAPRPKDEARPAVGKGLYPPYEAVAARLGKSGVPRDFFSTAPLRYTHRHTGDGDVYFVANPSDQAQAARCEVRDGAAQAECWDPLTGAAYDISASCALTGQGPGATVALSFAPHQSAFIVFPRAAKTASMPLWKGEPSPCLDIPGPWQVAFDRQRGGPETAAFSRLEDWTTRREEGIRHYSGKACYHTPFDMPEPISDKPDTRYSLSLGTVHDVASVKLNGRELGVAWCDPWEVIVPAELLRAKGNELEITVANRWPNRMIGDLQVPGKKRVTKTTWNPFTKNSPLLPSGLIGPVHLVRYTRTSQP